MASMYWWTENIRINPQNAIRSQEWRERPEAKQALGPLIDRIPAAHPQIFPNFWVTGPAWPK